MSRPLASLLIAFAAVGLLSAAEAGVRLKDLVAIKGVRDNQLHGIGIVVGLDGTGDKTGGTVRMLRNFLASQNLQFTESDLASKNVAMVAVTADFPVFAKEGSRLVTQVSSIGDASSLAGGMLLETRLIAADGVIYAVGQGPLTIGGTGEARHAELVGIGVDHERHPTVAWLGEGALVEREVPPRLLFGDRLVLSLHEPDFTTAHLVATALAEVFDPQLVAASDAAQVTLGFHEPPSDADLVAAIARLEALRVTPDVPARVVVNVRTGTVVVGANVRIGKAAVSHGGLSLKVLPQVRRQVDPDDPAQVDERRVWTDPVTGIAEERPPAGLLPVAHHGTFNVLEGATVEDIANALNALGARPKDLVAIFQALRHAGALHAELVIH